MNFDLLAGFAVVAGCAATMGAAIALIIVKVLF